MQPAPMKKRRGRGFMKFLMWLILLAAVAGGVYYWQHQKVSDLQKQLADANSQINRLNAQNYSYQQQLQAANQKAQAQLFLTVKEWSVKIPVSSATADLGYTMGGFNGKQNAQAAFRTKQLDSMFPSCTTDSIILVRGQASDNFSGTGTSAKTFKQQYTALLADKTKDWTKNFKPQLIGNYYYIQGQTGAACATKVADVTQEKQIQQNIVDALNKLSAS
jgi:outer membrane murein-binding lipoprotein Lpp